MYGLPRARIATAEDLIASMDRAGIDASVVQGFPWSASDLCREMNGYLLEAAARYGPRLIPFCTVPPFESEAAALEAERCAAAGARGLGEMRLDAAHDPEAWKRLGPLADVCRSQRLIMLVHGSEPVGRWYPGKGTTTPDLLYRLAATYPDLRIVGAHLGGGLPFYAALPDVRLALANFYVDTAVWPLLYRPEVFPALEAVFGTERVLFASDYPVLSQQHVLDLTRALPFPETVLCGVLGGNAARLLRTEAA